MERYTYRTPDGTVLLTDELDGRYTANEVIDELAARLASYEETELDPDTIKALARMCAIMKMEIDRLHHFEMLKKDGRLWEAPCKMGTTLYMIVTKRPKLSWPEFSFIKTTYLTENNFFRVIRSFGKTVFLSKEEAESALAKDTNVPNKTVTDINVGDKEEE